MPSSLFPSIFPHNSVGEKCEILFIFWGFIRTNALKRIKVWRTNCFLPAFEFSTTVEVVNNVVKGAKIQISLNVYAPKCGSKQIRNLAPFSTSLPTSAEECQKFKISLPHFENQEPYEPAAY